MADLMKMARCKIGRPPAYIYDAVNRSVELPHRDYLPWPVEYLLGHHHRKYIFANNSIPSIRQVHIATQQWCRKRIWQLRLEEDESVEDPSNEMPKRKLKSMATRNPIAPLPPNDPDEFRDGHVMRDVHTYLVEF